MRQKKSGPAVREEVRDMGSSDKERQTEKRQKKSNPVVKDKQSETNEGKCYLRRERQTQKDKKGQM